MNGKANVLHKRSTWQTMSWHTNLCVKSEGNAGVDSADESDWKSGFFLLENYQAAASVNFCATSSSRWNSDGCHHGKHCFLRSTALCGFLSFVSAVAVICWCGGAVIIISTVHQKQSCQNCQRRRKEPQLSSRNFIQRVSVFFFFFFP